MHVTKGEGARLSDRFISFMTDYGNEPDPPWLDKGGHGQVPKASTSKWDNVANDTLVDGVSILGS